MIKRKECRNKNECKDRKERREWKDVEFGETFIYSLFWESVNRSISLEPIRKVSNAC